MVAQTILPFKLEITNDMITPRAGLALLGELICGLRLPDVLDRELPGPGSGAGFMPSQFVVPLMLMFNGGGRSLEDLREIRMDFGLLELLGIDKVPSSDTTGDWLRRMGDNGGLGGLSFVNRELLRRGMVGGGERDWTLDIDATEIVAEKQEALWTYKGNRGYMPILGHIAENGMVVGDEFRAGNESPASRNMEFIKYCVSQMPEGTRIARLRSDSAAYQADIFNWCEDNSIRFAIGAPLDVSVMATIRAIPEKDWVSHGSFSTVDTVHSMDATEKSFSLVVVRRPFQQDLFSGESRIHYNAIATNLDYGALDVLSWYNRRGETSENRIKELKLGFGMERMPCGQFEANAVFFRIGVLAHNFFLLLKKFGFSNDWLRHQVGTFRWRFYNVAGKVVFHARRIILKVGVGSYSLFEDVRRRCYEFAFS